MPLWLAAAPLVLASRSAVRRTLLEAAGVPVEICPADIDERGVEAGAPLQAPVAIAALLAREKASVITVRNRGRLILGADQTLSLDGRRFTKPADRASGPGAAASSFPAAPMSFIRRSPLSRMVLCCSNMSALHG